MRNPESVQWGRAVISAFAANIVTLGSLGLLFGNPFISGLIYTDRAGQSEKVLSVWLEMEPLPAVTPMWDDMLDFNPRRLAVHALLLLWSLGLVVIYAKIRNSLDGGNMRKGLLFGAGTWLVLWVFFEAWVPFNMLGEPFTLTVVELALELVAMLATGVTIALLYRPAEGAY